MVVYLFKSLSLRISKEDATLNKAYEDVEVLWSILPTTLFCTPSRV